MKKFLLLPAVSLSAIAAFAQDALRVVEDRCGTMQRLETKFERNPELKKQFEAQRSGFNTAQREGRYKLNTNQRTDAESSGKITYTIPVVFHVVLKNPNVVSDAQVQAQLDTLNKDFFGANGDSVRIPSYFKALFGKSSIQFCLAQRTPNGDPTSGIERITTAQSSFSTNDAVKSASTGGADAWNTDKYFNVWLCILSNNILGYSTFPNDGAANEQGVVIDYRSLPGGSFTAYNAGKTLTHETGHYFNLYHIWGDDNGTCTGTDDVDDTPNQANSSSGTYTGIKTDNCTTGGNGIMYQNYMDYTNDVCLVMFTRLQVDRMESALAAYRSSLLTSDGCQSPVQRDYDVELVSIDQPSQRLCSPSYMPMITIINRGLQTLTSVNINSRLDDGTVETVNWTGSLAKSSSANVTLKSSIVSAGVHILTVYVTNPNNRADEDPTTDSASLAFQYFSTVTSIAESFESTTFAPAGWDIVNVDKASTWKRVAGIAKTGSASAMIDNFSNSSIGQKDDLRLPNLNLTGVDSAYLSFQVAAATFSSLSTAGNSWDTLEVLISTDCGTTYNSLYKKWGDNLVTRTAASTTSFIPTTSEWRKDSVNLINYIDANNIIIAFRNTNGNENNIYLDNVNLRTVVINPNLKSQGFLVTPNPTTGEFAVQFYPPPANLKAIQVYNLTGQKVTEVNISGQAGSYYNLNIGNYSSGTYIVRVVLADRVIIRKIIKL